MKMERRCCLTPHRSADKDRQHHQYSGDHQGQSPLAHRDEETKHRLTMAQLRGMQVEMLDLAYNKYRLERHGINVDEHLEYRTYQTFYEMGIAPPSHQEMADVIIERLGRSSNG